MDDSTIIQIAPSTNNLTKNKMKLYKEGWIYYQEQLRPQEDKLVWQKLNGTFWSLSGTKQANDG